MKFIKLTPRSNKNETLLINLENVAAIEHAYQGSNIYLLGSEVILGVVETIEEIAEKQELIKKEINK